MKQFSIDMRFIEIDDPKGLCKDVTNLGRWGNGDVEVSLSSAEQIEDVMYLVGQSFERNVDNGGDVRLMRGVIKLIGKCIMQETKLDQIVFHMRVR